MTSALQMLRAIQSRSPRSSAPPDLTARPFLNASGGLVVPFRSSARYRWWEHQRPESERLTICAILRELGAAPEVDRAYCGAGRCTEPAVPEQTEPLKPGGLR